MRQSATGVRSAGRTLNFATAKGRISESENLKYRRQCECADGNKSMREYIEMENVPVYSCFKLFQYELKKIYVQDALAIRLFKSGVTDNFSKNILGKILNLKLLYLFKRKNNLT